MAILLSLVRLLTLASNVYTSYKALRPPSLARGRGVPSVRAAALRKRRLKACLSVWIVWAAWSSVEKLADSTMGLVIPFYTDIKTFFLVILYLTRAIIAEPLLLHFIRPLLKPYISTIDSALDLLHAIGELFLYLILAPMRHWTSLPSDPDTSLTSGHLAEETVRLPPSRTGVPPIEVTRPAVDRNAATMPSPGERREPPHIRTSGQIASQNALGTRSRRGMSTRANDPRETVPIQPRPDRPITHPGSIPSVGERTHAHLLEAESQDVAAASFQNDAPLLPPSSVVFGPPAHVEPRSPRIPGSLPLFPQEDLSYPPVPEHFPLSTPPQGAQQQEMLPDLPPPETTLTTLGRGARPRLRIDTDADARRAPYQPPLKRSFPTPLALDSSTTDLSPSASTSTSVSALTSSSTVSSRRRLASASNLPSHRIAAGHPPNGNTKATRSIDDMKRSKLPLTSATISRRSRATSSSLSASADGENTTRSSSRLKTHKSQNSASARPNIDRANDIQKDGGEPKHAGKKRLAPMADVEQGNTDVEDNGSEAGTEGSVTKKRKILTDPLDGVHHLPAVDAEMDWAGSAEWNLTMTSADEGVQDASDDDHDDEQGWRFTPLDEFQTPAPTRSRFARKESLENPKPKSLIALFDVPSPPSTPEITFQRSALPKSRPSDSFSHQPVGMEIDLKLHPDTRPIPTHTQRASKSGNWKSGAVPPIQVSRVSTSSASGVSVSSGADRARGNTAAAIRGMRLRSAGRGLVRPP